MRFSLSTSGTLSAGRCRLSSKRAKRTTPYEPYDALGMIEADREYAKHRLEMVWATSITTIESSDNILIRIKKFKEGD